MLEEILEFVRDIVEIDTEVNKDTLLYSSGLMNSMRHVQLISYLEETYQQVIPIGSVNEKNFDTVEAITRFINELKVNQ